MYATIHIYLEHIHLFCGLGFLLNSSYGYQRGCLELSKHFSIYHMA